MTDRSVRTPGVAETADAASASAPQESVQVSSWAAGSAAEVPSWQRLLFVASLPVLIVAAWWWASDDPATTDSARPFCVLYRSTGIYCPGCGAGRSAFRLLHLRLFDALRYNPLFVILVPWMAWWYATTWWRMLVASRKPWGTRYLRLGIWLAVAILLYAVLRNLPWGFLDFLRPPAVA